MKINFLKKLFNKKQKIKPEPLPLDFDKDYPKVTLSEEFNHQAYNLFFLSDDKPFCLLTSLLVQRQPSLNVDSRKMVQDFSNETGSIFKVNFLDDFNGTIIHLITNDSVLIREIQKLDCYPPMPTTSFPKLNPAEYGSLQGDLDFWFTWLWLPYWKSLTEKHRRELSLSEEWREFIEMRT
jgi:hypothetical protein